jgi:hypothetical protein
MSPILGTIASSMKGVSGAFESIATATGTGSSGSITFNSIPSTYEHLQIRYIAKDTFGPGFDGVYTFGLQFNNDTGNNYAVHRLVNESTNVYAYGNASRTELTNMGSVTPTASYLTNTMAVGIIDIHDYSSTTKNKTVRSFSGGDTNSTTVDQTGQVKLSSGLWMNTNAITSITIKQAVSGYTTTSVFSLYGIQG